MKDPEPGRCLVGERPQALQIARHGTPAEVELARDAGKAGRAHDMLEPAARAYGLAEPVEPEAITGARVEGRRARREREGVVHDDGMNAVLVPVGGGNGRARGRQDLRLG